jgi:hypothetical protein
MKMSIEVICYFSTTSAPTILPVTTVSCPIYTKRLCELFVSFLIYDNEFWIRSKESVSARAVADSAMALLNLDGMDV